jgi:hypothetical protein
MNITRRKVLAGLAAIPFTIGIRSAGGVEPETAFTGSWHVSSAVNSIVLSIEPGEKALVLLLESGSFSMARSTWKPLPGGILVESMPRFRLWAGRDQLEVRVEMDLPAELDTSEGWRDFPGTFFMRRIEDAELPKALRDRPLPAGWEKAALDKEWDLQAGHRRQKIKTDAEPTAAPPRR